MSRRTVQRNAKVAIPTAIAADLVMTQIATKVHYVDKRVTR